jgi:hypothetical protein
MSELNLGEKSNQLENYTDEQKQTLVRTIKKKEGINLWLGLEELWRTIGVWEKKNWKNSNNTHLISEELERYDKTLGKKRKPILS